MSETNLPETKPLTWQDAIDRRLQQRLIRPLVQPGLINTSGLTNVIISRSQRLGDRLPLLTELNQRFSSTTTWHTDEIPIVYAQPLSNQDNTVKNLTTSVGSSIPDVQLVYAQSLPSQNNTADNFNISESSSVPQVQLKEAQLKEVPVVQAKLATGNQSKSISQVGSNLPSNRGNNGVAESLEFGIQYPANLDNNLQINNSATFSNLLSQPLENFQSKPENHFVNKPEIQLINQPISLYTSVQSEVESRPNVKSDFFYKKDLNERSTLIKNSNNSLHATHLSGWSLPVILTPETLESNLDVDDKSSRSNYSQSSIYEKSLIKKDDYDIANNSHCPSLNIDILPIIQAKLSSLPDSKNNSDYQLTSSSKLPSPELSLTLPNERVNNDGKSLIHMVKITNNSSYESGYQANSLLNQLSIIQDFKSEIINNATANVNSFTKTSEQLPTNTNGLKVTTTEKRRLPSQPLVTQKTRTSWRELDTPLLLSIPPLIGQLAVAGNGSQRLATQQYSAGVKPEISKATEAMNAGTVSRPATPVFQSTAANAKPPTITTIQESSFSPATTDTKTPIDVDVLADKIERKLMRRLVIENERRGQKRWR